MSNYTRSGDDAVVLSFREILGVILRGWWVILLSTAVFTAGTFLVNDNLVTPQYQASVLFCVNNNSFAVDNRFSTSDMAVSKALVDTYVVILESQQTMEQIVTQAGVGLTVAEAEDMLRVTTEDELEFFRVTFVGEDPQNVGRLAGAAARVFPERVSQILVNARVSVADESGIPAQPTSPNVTRSTAGGFLFGFAFGATLLLMRALFGHTIKKKEDVEVFCDCPVLAEIPQMGGAKNSGASPILHTSGAESYKRLRTRLEFSFADEEQGHVIGVASALAGEGKSTSAVNLAASLAQRDGRVLLIDCDLRRPTISEKLRLHHRPGLSEWLTHHGELEQIIQRSKLKSGEFDVICAGRPAPNPLELLSSRRMEQMLAGLREKYDWIILDLPPVGEVSDALTVSRMASGIVMVVRRGRCSRQRLRAALGQFGAVNARVLGVVVNCVKAGK